MIQGELSMWQFNNTKASVIKYFIYGQNVKQEKEEETGWLEEEKGS